MFSLSFFHVCSPCSVASAFAGMCVSPPTYFMSAAVFKNHHFFLFYQYTVFAAASARRRHKSDRQSGLLPWILSARACRESQFILLTKQHFFYDKLSIDLIFIVAYKGRTATRARWHRARADILTKNVVDYAPLMTHAEKYGLYTGGALLHECEKEPALV